MRFTIGLLLLLTFLCAACQKHERISQDPNAMLHFSTESVLFDTLITSVGSTTQVLKVRNDYHDALKISEIRLTGGETSPFKININGESTTNKQDLILNGKDSLNIFIKVMVPADNRTLPFLIQDSIILITNNNRQVIQLKAYGQNAVFINSLNLTTHTTWDDTLPYVISGTLNIAAGTNLHILPGAKIYFHKDAGINVEGNLYCTGSNEKPILISSDRMELNYSDEPGQWKGIYLKAGGSALITYSTIKNALVGITADSLATGTMPKLILSNSIIKNMSVAAYIGYHSELNAFNNLMYNCGSYLIYAAGGGNYNLKQNTLVGFNPAFARKNAALSFSDYLSSNRYNRLKIDLVNNIIWGNLVNELDIQQKTNQAPTLNILSNMIKSGNTQFSGNGNLLNTDPLFVAATQENFKPGNSSIAVGKGITLTADPYFNLYLSKDLNNQPRIFPSTLGCYEKK